MEIPEELRCLFTARIDAQNGSYVIDVPDDELRLGTVRADETYRIAILPAGSADGDTEATPERTAEQPSESPPVDPGDERTVEIEGTGDQGDGIARVERGFVVIVPDTEQGERVRIEITDVQENVAFAEVHERFDYYE